MKFSAFTQYQGSAKSLRYRSTISLSMRARFNRARSDDDDLSDHPADYAFAVNPTVSAGHSISNRAALTVTLSRNIAFDSPSCRPGLFSVNTLFISFLDSALSAIESRADLTSTALSDFLPPISTDLLFSNHKSPNP